LLIASKFTDLNPAVNDFSGLVAVVLLMLVNLGVHSVVLLVLVILIMLVYFVLMEASFGATLGKLAAEARVQRLAAQPMSLETSITRNAFRLVDGLLFYLPGALLVMVTPKRQRLGDLMAGTIVVHRPTNTGLRVGGLALALIVAGAGVAAGWGVIPPPANAGPPRVSHVIVSDQPNGAATKTEFTTAAPEIYVIFTLASAPPGTTMRATWIAENVRNTPRDSRLGEAEVKSGGIPNGGSFRIAAPNGGWAPGDYRVELYLNGSLAQTERFRVVPLGAPQGSPSPVAATPTPTRQISPTTR